MSEEYNIVWTFNKFLHKRKITMILNYNGILKAELEIDVELEMTVVPEK